MASTQTPGPVALTLAALALALAVGAPVWAFFNITVEFPPMVGDDSGATNVNSPIEINLLANDADPDGRLDASSVTIIERPLAGALTVNPQTGACTYTPAPDFEGSDRFSYQIRDDEGVPSNIGFVTLRVMPRPVN
jgi:hypothetical protein